MNASYLIVDSTTMPKDGIPLAYATVTTDGTVLRARVRLTPSANAHQTDAVEACRLVAATMVPHATPVRVVGGAYTLVAAPVGQALRRGVVAIVRPDHEGRLVGVLSELFTPAARCASFAFLRALEERKEHK